MIIKTQSFAGGFYDKSEYEFLGREIDYKFMTTKQLDKSIADSANLYNEMFPVKKSGLQKFMKVIITTGLIVGTAGVVGAAIIASYGIPLGTAMGAMTSGATAVAAKGSVLAQVQTAASGVVIAGGVYGAVTGDTPEDLMKAADYVSSPTALDAMEKVTKQELASRGAVIQEKDTASNDALRERLKREQRVMSEKLTIAANKKARAMGEEPPKKKKINPANAIMLATPFLLYFLG